MGNDIWSGNEHFLRGQEIKKSKKLSSRTKFISGIVVAVLFIILIAFYPSKKPEEPTLESEFVEEDFEKYRNMPTAELLKMLNEEKGLKDLHPLKEFEIVAKKYVFEPDEINAKVDDLIRLKVKAVDINHSIRIPTFFVSKYLPAAEEVIIEFPATKAGEFRFSSEEYEEMVGKIIITE